MGPLCLSLYLIKKREAKAKVISEKQKQWQFHFHKDKFVRAEAGHQVSSALYQFQASKMPSGSSLIPNTDIYH